MAYHPLDDPTGGSLSSVALFDHEVHKSYAGSLPRGYDKLRKEHAWLVEASRSLGPLVPRAIGIEETSSPRTILLRLERLPKIAVAKALLSGVLAPSQLGAIIEALFSALTDSVYPMHRELWTGSQLYDVCQRERITLAKRYLQDIPYVWAFWSARSMTVNGVSCPTVSEFIAWLSSHKRAIYRDSAVWAFHGNLHLDNVLVQCPLEDASLPDIAIIDPRGDVLGPIHSDVAKLLVTLEAGYDLIHYNRYDVHVESSTDDYQIRVRLNADLNEHYGVARARVMEWLPALAAQEGVSDSAFLHAVHVTMCVHVLSFCFYHAYRSDAVPNRVRSFLATFALLARRAMRDPGAPVSTVTASELQVLWE